MWDHAFFDYCFRVHLDHNTPHKKLVSLSHYRYHLVFFLVTYAMGNVNYTYLQEHSAFVFQKSVILKRKNWGFFSYNLVECYTMINVGIPGKFKICLSVCLSGAVPLAFFSYFVECSFHIHIVIHIK